MIKILGIHIQFIDDKKVMNVAYESKPGHYKSKYRQVNGISAYDAQMCIVEGKIHPEDISKSMFSEISETHGFDKENESLSYQNSIKSLKELYQETCLFIAECNLPDDKLKGLISLILETHNVAATDIVNHYKR